MSARSCCSVAGPSSAPAVLTAAVPAVQPQRAHASRLAPRSRPSRKPHVKKSPAPIVSTTGTLAAAATAVLPSAALRGGRAGGSERAEHAGGGSPAG